MTKAEREQHAEDRWLMAHKEESVNTRLKDLKLQIDTLTHEQAKLTCEQAKIVQHIDRIYSVIDKLASVVGEFESRTSRSETKWWWM